MQTSPLKTAPLENSNIESSAATILPSTEMISEEEQRLLETVRSIAEDFILPRAQMVDTGKETPWENLSALADSGLIGITTPKEWGGQATSGAFQREFTETMTSVCGTTWFILTQHLGSCTQIANSENPVLRERFLRDMASGKHYVGVGFGHLRRPQAMLRAEIVPGGYILNGTAPWVTGWSILSGVIFGATLPDERHVYLYADAKISEHLRSSPPLPLCAMNATDTTEVHLTDLFLPDENWIKFSDRSSMARGDRSGIASGVHPPLGCARGSLRLLRETFAKRPIAEIGQAADLLAKEIDECRANARKWDTSDKQAGDYEVSALTARTWAIELGVRAAHMAVTASSGGANSLDHPAQRLFREAMFYTLTAQTGTILTATLRRLAHDDLSSAL